MVIHGKLGGLFGSKGAITTFEGLMINAVSNGTGNAKGIYHGDQGAGTTVNGNAEINVTSNAGQALGVHNYWGDAVFNGNTTITATSKNGLEAWGVNNDSHSSVTFGKDAVIRANSAQSTATGLQNVGSKGIIRFSGAADISADGQSRSFGVSNADSAEITFASKAKISAVSNADGKFVFGISNNNGTISFENAAEKVEISANNGDVAYGLDNKDSASIMTFAGDTTIQAKGAYGMGAHNAGTLEFKKAAKLTSEAVGAQQATGVWNENYDTAKITFGDAAEITAKAAKNNAHGIVNKAGTITFNAVGQTAKITADSASGQAFGLFNEKILSTADAIAPAIFFKGAAEITASGGKFDSISVYNKGGTIQFGQAATLKALSHDIGEDSLGILNEGSGTIVFNGRTDIIAAAGNDSAEHTAWGILNKERSTIDFNSGANIKVDLNSTKLENTVFGTRNQGGKLTFSGQPVTIAVNAKGGEAYGVVNNIIESASDYGHTLFNTDTAIRVRGNAAQGVWNEKGTTFFRGKADISAIADHGMKRALGVQSDNGGTVKFFGDTTIYTQAVDPAEAYALLADNSATVEVNTGGLKNAVKITGHLKATDNGKITLVLDNANAGFDGLVFEESGGIVDLKLKNSGTWRPTGDADIAMNRLYLGGQGVVDLTAYGNGNYRTLKIADLSGKDGIFKLNTDLKHLTGDKLVLRQITNGSNYWLLITDASMNDAADHYTREEYLEIARLEDQNGKQLTFDTIPVVKGDHQYKIVLHEAFDGADKTWSFNDLGSTKPKPEDPPVIPPDPDNPVIPPDPDDPIIPPDPDPEVPDPPKPDPEPMPTPPATENPFPEITTPTVTETVKNDRDFIAGDTIVPNSGNGIESPIKDKTVKIQTTPGANDQGLTVQVLNAANETKYGAYAVKDATLAITGSLHIQAGGIGGTAVMNKGTMSFGAAVDPSGKLTVDTLLQSGTGIGIYTDKDAITNIYQNAEIQVKSNHGQTTGVSNSGTTNFNNSLTISAASTGIYDAYGSKNDAGSITFKDATIQADSQNGTAFGIQNNTKTSEMTFDGKALINASSASKAKAVMNRQGTLNFAAANIQVKNTSTNGTGGMYGIENTDGGKVTFSGDAQITVQANKGQGFGVMASQNSTVSFEQAAKITTQGNKSSYGVYSSDGSQIDFKGALEADATAGPDTDAYALYANNNSIINVNQNAGGNTVKITGDINAMKGSVINLALDHQGSKFTGLVEESSGGKVNLTLKNGGTWNPTGTADVSINALNLEKDGIVNLGMSPTKAQMAFDLRAAAPDNYRNLRIGNLTGTEGIFNLNTDLQNLTGDHLTFNNVVNGSKHYLLITDVSMNDAADHYTQEKYLEIARLKDQDGKQLTFDTIPVVKGDHQYKIVLYEAINGADKTWSFNDLGSTKPVDPEPPIGPIISLRDDDLTAKESNVSLLGLQMLENNNLIKRMGELHTSNEKQGIWARVYNGKQKLDGGRAIDQRYNGVQIGYDHQTKNAADNYFVGAAVSNLDASTSYQNGSGSADSTSFGIYGTWQGNSGHYVDVIAKHSWMKADHNSAALYYDNDLGKLIHSVKGNYKTNSNSISLEYGYRQQLTNGWDITPQVELTVGRIDGVSYQADNGRNIRHDSVNSTIGRLGFIATRQLGDNAKRNSFHLKASIAHEFSGKVNTHIGSLSLEEDLSGTWIEYGIGLNHQMSDTGNLYLDLERSSGGKIQSDWQINTGVRYSF